MSEIAKTFNQAGKLNVDCLERHVAHSSSSTFQQRSKDSTHQTSPRVTLRLTVEEHARLTELAHGMTLSAYIRACLFHSDVAPRKRKKREPVKDEKALAELLGLLGQSRIANNLNQLAYQANAGSLLLDDHSLAMITEAYDYVRFMRSQLILALGIGDIQTTVERPL
ncbi:MAG: plasmid mobilization relaxosome protein MobC [Pseudomonadota bacterium]